MSIFNWGIYIGYASSFLVAQIFTEDVLLGWRTSYILTGAIGLVMVPGLLYFVKVKIV